MARPVGIIYASTFSRRDRAWRRWRRRRVWLAVRATTVTALAVGSAAAGLAAERLTG